MKSRQEIIDEVMDYMDFEKIHKTMKVLKWKYFDIAGVPEIHDIRKHLRKMLNECLDKDIPEMRCGGFRIRIVDKEIIVTFEVCSWEVNKDEDLVLTIKALFLYRECSGKMVSYIYRKSFRNMVESKKVF